MACEGGWRECRCLHVIEAGEPRVGSRESEAGGAVDARGVWGAAAASQGAGKEGRAHFHRLLVRLHSSGFHRRRSDRCPSTVSCDTRGHVFGRRPRAKTRRGARVRAACVIRGGDGEAGKASPLRGRHIMGVASPQVGAASATVTRCRLPALPRRPERGARICGGYPQFPLPIAPSAPKPSRDNLV